ncbi:GntR family transcriptional regulator [Klebsiella pneumoniae]|nr:GntR family transcriptional regulator [Klebsiella pneumoniae]
MAATDDNVLREDGSALLVMAKPRAILCCERYRSSSGALPGHPVRYPAIVITEGALEGVNLCASLLTNPGDSVWLEETGYLGARSGFQRADCGFRGMAVDR